MEDDPWLQSWVPKVPQDAVPVEVVVNLNAEAPVVVKAVPSAVVVAPPPAVAVFHVLPVAIQVPVFPDNWTLFQWPVPKERGNQGQRALCVVLAI